jgi:hypothetical protein
MVSLLFWQGRGGIPCTLELKEGLDSTHRPILVMGQFGSLYYMCLCPLSMVLKMVICFCHVQSMFRS